LQLVVELGMKHRHVLPGEGHPICAQQYPVDVLVPTLAALQLVASPPGVVAVDAWHEHESVLTAHVTFDVEHSDAQLVLMHSVRSFR
jgi:hypothetical protein